MSIHLVSLQTVIPPTTPGYTEDPCHFPADAWQTSGATYVWLHMDSLLKPEQHPGIAAAHFLPNIAHDPALQTTSMMVNLYPDIPPALASTSQVIPYNDLSCPWPIGIVYPRYSRIHRSRVRG
jgi:hypothetical protein